jgi:hypothetical protein
MRESEESSMDLRVVYAYDGEGDAWGGTIPSLGVVGSGATRAEVEEQACIMSYVGVRYR